MSLACAAFFVIVGAAFQEGEIEAEKLFRAMETKLRATKTLRFTFEGKSDIGDNSMLKAKLTIAAVNKLHFSFDGNDLDGPINGLVVADGRTLALKGVFVGKNKSLSNPVPEKLNEHMVGNLTRGSFLMALDRAIGGSALQIPEALKLSGFKFSGREKVGTRDTQVMQYKIEPDPGDDEQVTFKVWIDIDNQLPLKRLIEGRRRNGDIHTRIIETFGEWDLEPKLSNEFVLPK